MWQDIYLGALTNGLLQATARKHANVTKKTWLEYRAANPEWAEAEDAILEQQTDTLEAEARRRALGYTKEHADGSVTTAHSDSLLMFMLKAKRQEAFGDKLATTHNGPLSITLRDMAADLALTTSTTVSEGTALAQAAVAAAIPHEAGLLDMHNKKTQLKTEAYNRAIDVLAGRPQEIEVDITP